MFFPLIAYFDFGALPKLFDVVPAVIICDVLEFCTIGLREAIEKNFEFITPSVASFTDVKNGANCVVT